MFDRPHDTRPQEGNAAEPFQFFDCRFICHTVGGADCIRKVVHQRELATPHLPDALLGRKQQRDVRCPSSSAFIALALQLRACPGSRPANRRAARRRYRLQPGGKAVSLRQCARVAVPWGSSPGMPAQRLQSWFVTPICPIREPFGYRYRYTIRALRSRNTRISPSQ